MMHAAYVDSAMGSIHAAGMKRKEMPSARSTEMSKPRMILARNLEALMEVQGWNQTELDRRSGVSQRHISDILNRKTDATGRVIDSLAKAFGREGYELLIEGLDAQVGNATPSNLDAIVSAYVRDPSIRRLLDAALGLTLPKKP